MHLLPVSLNIKNKPCLIIGEQAIAKRKLNLLLKACAQVDVICEESLDADFLSMITQSGGQQLNSTYNKDVLGNYYLVIVASEDKALAEKVAQNAEAIKLPVNVYKQPDLSSFSLPYLIDRDPITIAVSSSGVSSIMTRLIQARINALIPVAIGQLAKFFTGLQKDVKARLSDKQDRRRFWESMLEGAVAERIYQGELEQAKTLFDEQLAESKDLQNGEVYLIGAGPGDPDLLTFKALRLLQSADVVLYDRLVNESILDFARPDALKLYVGKAMSNHSVPQGEINQWLINHAKQGKRVARLKGGDPFIFGRGGEEIEDLADAQIPFQVIPGITAANGCSAYSGIPLTHRDFAQSVRFITGHLKKGALTLDWPSFVSADQTLVFYMGLSNINTICEQLIKHGRTPETNVALIEKGTTREQKVIVGTLSTLPDILTKTPVKSPALTIVGDVVSLRDKLDWFGKTQ